LLNLNQEKAWEHSVGEILQLRESGVLTEETPTELLHFLAWQGLIKPTRIPAVNRYMLPQNQLWAESVMKAEDWHQDVKAVCARYEVSIRRTIAVDAWTLCLLAFDEKLGLLGKFDEVYVSHGTIFRLLEEAKRTALYQVHQVLVYIEKNKHANVIIRSADFRHQIDVRERVDYDETANAVTIAIEKSARSF
jgi:hypothetical protein